MSSTFSTTSASATPNPAAWRGMRYPDSDLVGLLFRFVRPGRDVPQGARALDIGCGSGRHLLLLKEMGFNAYGIDIDQKMIDTAQANGFDALRTTLDAHTPDEPLALTVCWGFMCLAPNGEALVADLQAQYVIADWRTPNNSCFNWPGNETLDDGFVRLRNPGHVLDGQVYRAHDLNACELRGYERLHWQRITKTTGDEYNEWFQSVHRLRDS